MNPFELTGIKLWISASVLLPFALIFEQALQADQLPAAHNRNPPHECAR